MTVKNAFVPANVGDKVTFKKTLTVAEQAMFTGISGNLGGVYVDRSKAKEAGLADMAIFELVAASLLSTCLSRLAGPTYRIASFSIDFAASMTVGTTVAATAQLSETGAGGQSYDLLLEADGTTLSTGKAVLVPIVAR
ncbi:hotdog domain-containing protein [Mesorhizobium sp. CAU 1732]|uniref:hotdog domain-containing protein n=1 Tax=Mesorhizobium sp. CAU 1732 TaxID=3140358 RepID=UPI00326112D6